MSAGLAETLRVLRPAPHILAFYDGRMEGRRLHGPNPNWQDMDYTLGTCSYAVVAGGEALVYDTHLSLDHARAIRRAVEAEGGHSIRVVLSHHHIDHIAGNEVFADCPILANAATAKAMDATRAGVETGDPPVRPVVMPTEVFETDLDLEVGGIPVALRSFEIHSPDGLVLWLPGTRTLLAGDTLEDTVTYVGQPHRLPVHLEELARLAELPITRILPAHGDPATIAGGGYPPSFLAATRRYVAGLLACRDDPERAAMDLRGFLDDDLIEGAVIYHPPYERVHRQNVDAVLALDEETLNPKGGTHAP
ncbi:MAG: MBL fold metallo-hydrolase [Pseudomonadota bacterium]